jgi:hypothetical protein
MGPVAPEKIANLGARSVVWSFQLSDEQRKVALFSGAILRAGAIIQSAALSFSYVE